MPRYAGGKISTQSLSQDTTLMRASGYRGEKEANTSDKELIDISWISWESNNSSPKLPDQKMADKRSSVDKGSSPDGVSAFEPESSSWIQSKLKVELKGIERVTEDERLHDTTKFWNACTFW